MKKLKILTTDWLTQDEDGDFSFVYIFYAYKEFYFIVAGEKLNIDTTSYDCIKGKIKLTDTRYDNVWN